MCIVRFAYDQKCSSTSNKICAHKLRALSASFAWLNGIPLDAVLRAGFWRSEDSFNRLSKSYSRNQWEVIFSGSRCGFTVISSSV